MRHFGKVGLRKCDEWSLVKDTGNKKHRLLTFNNKNDDLMIYIQKKVAIKYCLAKKD